MIIVPRAIMDDMYAVGKKCYPHEGCGFMLGKFGPGDERRVERIYEARNTNVVRARDRFEINPKEFLQVDKTASQEGRDIVGFFHSHPDHPSRPSGFDREMAQPLYSYIIIAVDKGVETRAQSWHLKDEKDEFHEEVIMIVD